MLVHDIHVSVAEVGVSATKLIMALISRQFIYRPNIWVLVALIWSYFTVIRMTASMLYLICDLQQSTYNTQGFWLCMHSTSGSVTYDSPYLLDLFLHLLINQQIKYKTTY